MTNDNKSGSVNQMFLEQWLIDTVKHCTLKYDNFERFLSTLPLWCLQHVHANLKILYLDNFFTSQETMTKRNHQNAEKFMLTVRSSRRDLFYWPWRKRTPRKHIKRRRSDKLFGSCDSNHDALIWKFSGLGRPWKRARPRSKAGWLIGSYFLHETYQIFGKIWTEKLSSNDWETFYILFDMTCRKNVQKRIIKLSLMEFTKQFKKVDTKRRPDHK